MVVAWLGSSVTLPSGLSQWARGDLRVERIGNETNRWKFKLFFVFLTLEFVFTWSGGNSIQTPSGLFVYLFCNVVIIVDCAYTDREYNRGAEELFFLNWDTLYAQEQPLIEKDDGFVATFRLFLLFFFVCSRPWIQMCLCAIQFALFTPEGGEYRE